MGIFSLQQGAEKLYHAAANFGSVVSGQLYQTATALDLMQNIACPVREKI